MGRPRTPIGTFGEISFVKVAGGQVPARPRFRGPPADLPVRRSHHHRRHRRRWPRLAQPRGPALHLERDEVRVDGVGQPADVVEGPRPFRPYFFRSADNWVRRGSRLTLSRLSGGFRSVSTSVSTAPRVSASATGTATSRR